MLPRKKAIILIFLTAIMWSTGGFLIKSLPLEPLAIAGFRSLVSAIFLSLFIRRFHIKKWKYMIVGAFCYAGTVILFVVANKLTTAANSILLQYSAPVWVALLGSWFLREKVNGTDWIFIFVLMTGIFLFFLDELTLSGIWGNILAILSGVAFAGTVLLMRKQKDKSPLLMIILGNYFAAFICIPFVTRSFKIGDYWLTLIVLVIIQLGLPYILYSIAIRSLKAIEAILIPSVEAILNPLWVFIFYSEKPGLWSVLGGMVVLGSMVLYSIIINHRNQFNKG